MELKWVTNARPHRKYYGDLSIHPKKNERYFALNVNAVLVSKMGMRIVYAIDPSTNRMYFKGDARGYHFQKTSPHRYSITMPRIESLNDDKWGDYDLLYDTEMNLYYIDFKAVRNDG